ERTDAVYASGIRAADGSFAFATVTERGEIVYQMTLPARAHGMAISDLGAKAERKPRPAALTKLRRSISELRIIVSISVRKGKAGRKAD
ncbi:hypothetical protein ACC840_36180, partial [Rhizobium ruizarguesonis]